MAKGYDPKRLVPVLEELLEKKNESYREASLKAGLDHGSMRRYLKDGKRPSMNALFLLANHFEVNPNTLLVLADYPPMRMFEREPADLDKLTPDVRRLAEDLERIGDPTLRWRLAAALRLLIAGYLDGPD
jgi:transcriptional regulator with XRE-family HTH domain